MIRVLSKKALGFRNLDDNTLVTIRPLVLSEVPEWVVKDPIYKWALSDGTLDVLSDAPTIAEVSTPSPVVEHKEIHDMTTDELKALARERGLVVPSGTKKSELVAMLQGE